jgi:hypothetical protein
VVARKILDIACNGSSQLRHPVGPDALPLLQWRAAMSDEQWIALHSSDESTFAASMARDLNFRM